MITGILWRQSEFFLENWTCCLIHCLKSTNTNSFQIKKHPIFGWILLFLIFKEVLKSLLHFSPVWHSTVCQANDFLLNQILKYLLLFAFSLLRWLHLYAKIFWNIFELFSPRFLQVQRSRMVSPVNFIVEHSNNFKRVKHKKSSSFVHTLSSMTWA